VLLRYISGDLVRRNALHSCAAEYHCGYRAGLLKEPRVILRGHDIVVLPDQQPFLIALEKPGLMLQSQVVEELQHLGIEQECGGSLLLASQEVVPDRSGHARQRGFEPELLRRADSGHLAHDRLGTELKSGRNRVSGAKCRNGLRMSALRPGRHSRLVFEVKERYFTASPGAGHSVAELAAQARLEECDAARGFRHSVRPRKVYGRRKLGQRTPASLRTPAVDRIIEREQSG